ncbi:hypothetical protein C0995_005913 [Termitomyces sp. Mi166|nr:hypothetical protein C0995_005913 [Termitomyces sp. Mi166\
MSHIVALTNVNNTDKEQENEPVDEEDDHASQEGNEDKVNENNSKALFALTNELVEMVFMVNSVVNDKEGSREPTKNICMYKVKVLASKETLTCLVLKAPDEEWSDNVGGGDWPQSVDVIGL